MGAAKLLKKHDHLKTMGALSSMTSQQFSLKTGSDFAFERKCGAARPRSTHSCPTQKALRAASHHDRHLVFCKEVYTQQQVAEALRWKLVLENRGATSTSRSPP